MMSLLPLTWLLVVQTPSAPGVLSELITVDQLGYRPELRKVAVLADPIDGQNSALSYTPGARFEIRRVSDNGIVFRGTVTPWNGGQVSALAGDRVWHADFTTLRSTGEFYLYDPANRVRSFPFRINTDVYRGMLRAAVRTYYYQRANTAIPRRFGGNWNHSGGHIGPLQDREARFTLGGTVLGRPRNLAGGWYDAGDYTKYVPYLETTLFNLLWAFELNPGQFGDATGIPESGNSAPDLLDEIRWQLIWTLRMQDTDGGVFNRNGGKSFNVGDGPPNTDTQPRFYTSKTTWSTATAAGFWAHAARVYAPYESVYPGFTARLRRAAERAWAYLEARPAMEPTDGTDGAPDVTSSQASSNANADRRSRVLAAAQLFRLTGNAKYRTYVDTWAPNVAATEENGMHPFREGAYLDPLNYPALTQALFVYSKTPNATVSVVRRFRESLLTIAEFIRAEWGRAEDPYLNFMWPGHYSWGSNSNRCSWARILLMALDLRVNPGRADIYRSMMVGYLHFLHGRNPLAWCYLSNASSVGADKSVMSIYHSWFRHGSPLYDGPNSRFGPPPGYLVGGPNHFFTVDWIRPPFGEPAMKAYRDWNKAWNAERGANENSWEISEPAIYYQAFYVLILSQFTA